MSRGHIQGFAEQGAHTVVVSGNNSTTKFQESYPGCTVTVYLAGTTTTATIYSDMAGTSKSNPFTSDSTTAYWDFYAESTQRYDVKFSGTGIGTAFTLPDLRAGTDPTTVVNVKDYGALGDGTTDDTTAIRNAISLLGGNSGYAEIYFPPGTYKLTGSLGLNPRSDFRIAGAGMYQSILSISTGSGPILEVTIGTPKRDVAVQDLGFASTNGVGHVAIYADGTGISDTFAVERCRFAGLNGIFLGGYNGTTTVGSPTNVRVEDCVFQGLGSTVSSAIQAGSTKQMIVRGNEFRYQYFGAWIETVFGDATQEPSEYLQIIDNYFDGGWYTQVADFSGSTGVTYTANSLTDNGTTFSGIDTGAYTRAMVPYFTSSHTASFSGTKVTDSSATFTTWSVRKGAILRTGSAFAVVERVESQTVLWVEEWLSDSDRTPVLTPSTGTYTLYNVLLGQVTSFTAHTLTFGRNWKDLDGNETTPSNGTRYETQKKIGNHFVTLGSSARRCAVDRNRVRRCYADQITSSGTYCRITNNTIEYGQDMGITIYDCADNIVANNTVVHQGVSCIVAISAQNVTVAGNYCADSMAAGTAETLGTCIRADDAARVVITGNRCERTSGYQSPTVWLRYAVLVRSDVGSMDDGVISGNIANGFSTSYPQFVVRGSNAHRNQLLDNSGGASASEDSAVDTVIRYSATGATISPTQPRVVAYLSSTTTVGATLPWAVPFDANSSEVNVGGMHSTSTNKTRFTAPADGIYLAHGRFQFIANSSGLQRQAFLGKNGSTNYLAIAFTSVTNGTWPTDVTMTEIVQMATGDYIEFLVGHDASNTVTLNGGAAYATSGMLAKLW